MGPLLLACLNVGTMVVMVMVMRRTPRGSTYTTLMFIQGLTVIMLLLNLSRIIFGW